jgi:hypothetical protein
MALEILHNRASHTHENQQFRRITNTLGLLFEQHDWEGLIIGNPFNEQYSRFRADAILYYNNGIWLIDFKDYTGAIKLPASESDFQNIKWYAESLSDRSRIEIKAGSRFINPYRQLKAYRQAFYEVVESNAILRTTIKPSHVCAANIVTGPIEIQNDVPRSILYYKLLQENDLPGFLYDYASDNTFNPETAQELKRIFPAIPWDNTITITAPPKSYIHNIEDNIAVELNKFLNSNNQVLILESMEQVQRDNWMRYVYSGDHNFCKNIHLLAHSSRIGKKIMDRTKISAHSIYATIYGGNQQPDTEAENQMEDDEFTQHIVGLKESGFYDIDDLLIVHEAHLINRSLNQTDLLRFGSGRLLEDLFSFVNLENTCRKIIFIGDPYLISFGKHEDSALNVDTITGLFKGGIMRFKSQNQNATSGKNKIRYDLAQALDGNLFNSLEYIWESPNFQQVQTTDVEGLLGQWFSMPLQNEPDRAVLVYSRKDARKINLWIKKHCLKNGGTLAPGDLMLINNNINVIDPLGLAAPAKIVNGMYLKIISVDSPTPESIYVNKREVRLLFRKIIAEVLGLEGLPTVNILVLENFLESDSSLSKDEILAFRILINKKLMHSKTREKFLSSPENYALKQTSEYASLSFDEHQGIEGLIANYSISKELKQPVNTTQKARSILSQYYKRYESRLLRDLRETDPQINSAFASYGWATTVHKAVGSTFQEVIVNAFQGEANGINNADYFRWLYSGISSTTNSCMIINPQPLNPVQHCEFEDSEKVCTTFSSLVPSLLKYPGYLPDAHLKDKLADLSNENVLGTICELALRAEAIGYLISTAVIKSPFLTRVTFLNINTQEKNIVLDIDNKGAKENHAVSSVRIHSADADVLPTLKLLVDGIFSHASEKIGFPNDFRKSIYEHWETVLQNVNLVLRLVASHNNHDILIASEGLRIIKFKVWYGTSEREKTKGYINKIVVVEKSHADLGDLLKTLLL